MEIRVGTLAVISFWLGYLTYIRTASLQN